MKNYLVKLSKIVNKQSSSAGFTLIELLIAASLSIVVVGLSGFGVVAITENNNKSKAVTERRVELNRALDFISNEVRQARNIDTDLTAANLTIVAPSLVTAPNTISTFISSGKTPVLTLQIPGVPQRVIYYIASSASSDWLGPKVIYRWGPRFNSAGQYDLSTLNDPSLWRHEELVDLVVASTPSPNPDCQTGWLSSPAVANRQGFYACVNPNGKIAEIYLNGKLIGAYGDSIAPLKVSTKAFARSFQIASASAGGTPPPTPPIIPPPPERPATDKIFTTDNGVITFTKNAKGTFKIIGGDAGGIPTTTSINKTLDGKTTNTAVTSINKDFAVSGAAGTKLTVTGGATKFVYGGVTYGNFDAYSAETDRNKQVWTLRNGDALPSFTPFGTQEPPKNYLQAAGYLDANGRVKLADNQVIYLFEVTTTSQTRNDYDMQDIIVLATIS